jgi:hypothetical protein
VPDQAEIGRSTRALSRKLSLAGALFAWGMRCLLGSGASVLAGGRAALLATGFVIGRLGLVSTALWKLGGVAGRAFARGAGSGSSARSASSGGPGSARLRA